MSPKNNFLNYVVRLVSQRRVSQHNKKKTTYQNDLSIKFIS